MSADTPEISLTDTEFRKKILSAYQSGGVKTPRRFWLRGIFSDGTRYLVENGARGIDFYLVTDLTAPERRVGQLSVTVPLNVISGAAFATLSPVLADTVLTNYRLFATIDGAIQNLTVTNMQLATVSSLQIRIGRVQNAANTGTSLTGLTVGAGDLTDINTTVNTTHGADAGFAGHAHTTTGHPVTDPQHSHTVLSLPALTVNVDWLIWHV